MKHIFYIDPLEKLVMKKDSSLYLAATLQSLVGEGVYLLFKNDLAVSNRGEDLLALYSFSARATLQGVEEFSLGACQYLSLRKGDSLHMRLDPPVDGEYFRALWQLQLLQERGINVYNNPYGIAQLNEKIAAYTSESALSSYVGPLTRSLQAWLDGENNHQYFIIKPLDLYQGMGIAKCSYSKNIEQDLSWQKAFSEHKVMVVQPFYKDVSLGEVRAIFFDGQEIGSILKIPQEGSYLANIAQGAGHRSLKLTVQQEQAVAPIVKDFLSKGIRWVAFDILGNHVSEANLTCPGLLVEVSKAHQKNLAIPLAEKFLKK
jgi:glutathione synthase